MSTPRRSKQFAFAEILIASHSMEALETKEKIEEAAGLDFIAVFAALLASTETAGKSAQTEALNACPLRVKSGRDALRI